jgi:hypothetical protein
MNCRACVARDGQHGAAAQQLIWPLCLRAWGLHVRVCVFVRSQLETVAAFLAGHHPGDTGPGGSSKGPCAIAGMFGCAPAAASEEYGSVRAQAPLRAPGCLCSSQAPHGAPVLRVWRPFLTAAALRAPPPCPSAAAVTVAVALRNRVLRPEEDGAPRAARAATVTASRRVLWSTRKRERESGLLLCEHAGERHSIGSYASHGPMRCEKSTGKGRMPQSVEVEGVASVQGPACMDECRARTDVVQGPGDLPIAGI